MTAQTHGTDRAHETHDRLLVARFAVGDPLATDESAAVRSLLATCPACTDLIGEVRLVRAATAASPAPSRPRDFRLTPEQARTLRPGPWQRFLARLSAPRVAVMRPLAGATLAMGIVLVGAGAVIPRASDAPAPEAPTMLVMASPATGDNGASGTEAFDPAASLAAVQFVEPDAKASPGAQLEMAPFGSPAADRMLTSVPEGSPEADGRSVARVAEGSPTVDEGQQSEVALAESGPTADDRLSIVLLVAGLVMAAASLALLVLAWLARRTTDPLLR